MIEARNTKNLNSETMNACKVSLVFSIHQGARDYQEDACGHWSNEERQRLFAVVADGAGGHGGGAEASQAAVESSGKTWKRTAAKPIGNHDEFLTQWMSDAHLAVNEASAKISRSARAVVVGCLIDGNIAYWAHAGDSRLLRFRDGKLVERTRDDSVVQVLFERGEITEEEMGTHPDQSRLLQSLGGDDAPKPRLGRAELEEGDTLILCSDGFWEHLRREELEGLTMLSLAKRQRALDEAVRTAVRRAGPKADNTTAIMIQYGGTPPASCSCRWILWLLLATALGTAAWWMYGGKSWQWPPVSNQGSEVAKPDETAPSPTLPQQHRPDEEEPEAGTEENSGDPLLPSPPAIADTPPAVGEDSSDDKEPKNEEPEQSEPGSAEPPQANPSSDPNPNFPPGS